MTDDKVGAGPCLQLQSLVKPATIDLTDEAMDTDVDVALSHTKAAGESSQSVLANPSTQAQTPSSKLASMTVKCKATEPPNANEAAKT